MSEYQWKHLYYWEQFLSQSIIENNRYVGYHWKQPIYQSFNNFINFYCLPITEFKIVNKNSQKSSCQVDNMSRMPNPIIYCLLHISIEDIVANFQSIITILTLTIWNWISKNSSDQTKGISLFWTYRKALEN